MTCASTQVPGCYTAVELFPVGVGPLVTAEFQRPAAGSQYHLDSASLLLVHTLLRSAIKPQSTWLALFEVTLF